MIVVVNYGLGNLFSLSCSLRYIGAEHRVSADPDEIRGASRLILPGVGAFRDAAARLDQTGLGALVVRKAKEGVPLMGICLGMQLLFERSHEYGVYSGLGLIPGDVRPIEGDLTVSLKVPHIGWNALSMRRRGILNRHIREGDHVYYVHSYYVRCAQKDLVATSEYGLPIPGIVERGHVMGTQFHPEKSGSVGLRVLRAFCEVKL